MIYFSFSFRFVDENCRIFVVVVVFVTKINLFSSTKIFVFVVVDEKNTGVDWSDGQITSQVPYFEEFIGPPHTYTVDYDDVNALRAVLNNITSSTVRLVSYCY